MVALVVAKQDLASPSQNAESERAEHRAWFSCK